MRVWECSVAVLALCLFVVSPVAGSERSRLKPALERYEQELAELCKGGPLRERCVALKGLAAVASPAFDQCLASLQEVRDPYCLLDMCRAIGTMGGDHPGARRILTRALWTTDPRLLEAAGRAIQSLDREIAFREVWDPHRPPVFWAGEMGSIQIPVMGFSGVARAAPWNDPAWKMLPVRSQALVLARAGTRESLGRLEQLVQEHGEDLSRYISLGFAAESSPLVDRDGLFHLLASANRDLRDYAAASLAASGEPATIRRLLKSSDQRILGAGARGIVALADKGLASELCLHPSRPGLRNLCGRDHLALLDDDGLVALVAGDPGQWIEPVQRELLARGEPMSLYQVSGREPLPSGVTIRPPAELSGGWMKVEIGAMLREGDAIQLTHLLESAANAPRAGGTDLIWWLLDELRKAPSFVAAMPPALRSRCREALWRWYGAHHPGDTLSSSEVQAWVPRLVALALFDPPELRGPLWSAWLAEDQPLKDWRQIVFLMSGSDGYAGALRRRIGPVAGVPWLPRPFSEAVDAAMDTYHGSAWQWRWNCSGRGLPLAPGWQEVEGPRFREISGEFLGQLRVLYPEGSLVRLAADFLVARFGHGVLQRGRLEKLADHSPSTVAREANEVLRAMCKGCARPDIPPPEPVSGPARHQLDALLARARSVYFQGVVNEFLHPKRTPLVNACGVAPDISVGGNYTSMMPRGFLLQRCSPDLLPQLRALLHSDHPALRRDAEWAVWKMSRDSAIPEGWARELEAGPLEGRAQLLDMLIKVRRPEDEPLILSYLDSPDPGLRIRALDGVRVYRARKPSPRVLRLITDPEPSVARSTIGVLGLWRFPEAVPMLFQLAALDDRKLSNDALAVLTEYHQAEVIGRTVERLRRVYGEEKRRRRLMQILDGQALTLERGVLGHRPDRCSVADAEAVAAWWRTVARGAPGYGWIWHAFQQMVARLPNATKEEFDRGDFVRLDRRFGSFRFARREYPALVTAIRAMPDGDLFSLRDFPFTENIVPDSVLEHLDRKRVERRALETLFTSTYWRSQGEPARQTLFRLTGRDCGSLDRELDCSTRTAVEACWYDLGIEEGVWP